MNSFLKKEQIVRIQTGRQPPLFPLEKEYDFIIIEDQIINLESDKVEDNNNKNKSSMIDLFWFIHPKTSDAKYKFLENEVGLVIASLNLNFGNIRLSMYSNIRDMLRGGSVIHLDTSKQLAHGAIYPASQYQIKHLTSGDTVMCIEQLVTPYTGQEWQDKIPTVYLKKEFESNLLTLGIVNKFDRKEDGKAPSFKYSFSGIQYSMFMDMIDFCLKDGRHLQGSATLARKYN